MILVGVDAGASHTEAALATPDGAVIVRERGAGGATGPGRADRAAGAIADTIGAALRRAGEAPAAVVVGAAGAGNEEERAGLEHALRATLGLPCPIAVTTDVHIALDAAFPGEAGIVIVAGTGSVALARDPAGRLRRTGGYGPHAGDDAGGYALAREALGRAARGHDRRDPAAAGLLHRLLATRGARTFGDLVQWAQSAGYAEIATLAVEVAAAAAAGDAIASAAVEACAERLAELAMPLAKPFAPDAPRVALAGGLVQPGSPVREALERRLLNTIGDVQIMHEPVDPVAGALWQARRLAEA